MHNLLTAGRCSPTQYPDRKPDFRHRGDVLSRPFARVPPFFLASLQRLLPPQALPSRRNKELTFFFTVGGNVGFFSSAFVPVAEP